jgi:hypothetical protein
VAICNDAATIYLISKMSDYHTIIAPVSLRLNQYFVVAEDLFLILVTFYTNVLS